MRIQILKYIFSKYYIERKKKRPLDVLYERHKNLKDKKNKWSTMAGTFNATQNSLN